MDSCHTDIGSFEENSSAILFASAGFHYRDGRRHDECNRNIHFFPESGQSYTEIALQVERNAHLRGTGKESEEYTSLHHITIPCMNIR